jgi:hypothetical protein
MRLISLTRAILLQISPLQEMMFMRLEKRSKIFSRRFKKNYKTKILPDFKKRFERSSNFNANLKKAIHFASYFDPIHLERDTRLLSFLKNADFGEFYEVFESEENLSRSDEEISLPQFKAIVSKCNPGQPEITKITEKTKLLSCNWFLT